MAKRGEVGPSLKRNDKVWLIRETFSAAAGRYVPANTEGVVVGVRNSREVVVKFEGFHWPMVMTADQVVRKTV